MSVPPDLSTTVVLNGEHPAYTLPESSKSPETAPAGKLVQIFWAKQGKATHTPNK